MPRLSRRFAADVGDAETIANLLVEQLDLPSPQTKSGLIQWAKRFDVHYHRLMSVTDQFPNQSNIHAAVIAIFYKLSVDGVLLNLLAAKKNFMKPFKLALNNPKYFAFTLGGAAHIANNHQSRTQRSKLSIALTEHVLDIAERCQEDRSIYSKAISFLSHANSTLYAQSQTPISHSTSKRLLAMMVKCAQDPLITVNEHALELLLRFPMYNYNMFVADGGDALKVLVGYIRHPSIFTRQRVLLSIELLFQDLPEIAPLQLPKVTQEQLLLDAPLHFKNSIEKSYIWTVIEAINILNDARRSIECYRLASEDQLCIVARKFYTGIMQSDFDIIWIALDSSNEAGTESLTWPELLGIASNALRSQHNPSKQDIEIASVLELTLKVIGDVVLLENEDWKSLEYYKLTEPQNVAYYYYARTYAPVVTDEIYHMAKLGTTIDSAQIPAHLRCRLLYKASDYAYVLGLKAFKWQSNTDIMALMASKIQRGYCYIESARKDTLLMINEAPADCVHLRYAIQTYIISELLLRGHELSSNLQELQRAIDYSEAVKPLIARYFGEESDTRINRPINAILTYYPQVAEQYTEFFHGFENPINHPNHDEHAHAHPTISFANIKIYRCSNCFNASSTATLLQCSRCRTTKYCSSKCQRNHWVEHKRDCFTAEDRNT